MNKRKLGKTNLYINPIGFGGIPIQKVSLKEGKELVCEAVNKGINFFDSARSYTCSEEYLGESLKNLRDKVYIATKSMSRTYEKMKEDISLSLKMLKTDYIDLYQFHNVSKMEDLELIMSEKGAYKALEEAKKDNKIGHIGITSHSYDLLSYLLSSKYKDKFETIQFPYNFIEHDTKELFKKAKELNIGTIAMKPLGGGYIDDAKIALKYLLNDENLSVAIPGMSQIKELYDNISILDDYKLSNEDLLYIEKIQEEAKQVFCHRCGYCKPCTKGIDIPGIFTLENYYDRYGLKDWAITRYNNLEVKASACIDCKKCITKCPYNINIPERLKRIVNKFEV